MKKYATVNAYIKSFPEDVQARLETIRAIIKKAAPDAVESISYGMPGYKLNGKPLVYFGAMKKHIGFYATPSGNEAFQKELSAFKSTKGSVHFLYEEKLPVALITKMVKFKVKENSIPA